MTPYYNNPRNIDELRRVLLEWEDTPYRHRVCVKKKGADCIHFVAGVLHDMGIIRFHKKLVSDYARDWHLHNTREQLYEKVLETLPGSETIKDHSKIKDGDLPLYHYGKASAHIGVYLDGQVWQAIQKVGVVKVRYTDMTWKRRLTRIVRILI
jgi:cell wall-associated NlpC family hydrolase